MIQLLDNNLSATTPSSAAATNTAEAPEAAEPFGQQLASAMMTKQEAMDILSGAQQGDVNAARTAYYGPGGYYAQSPSVVAAGSPATTSSGSSAPSGVLMTPQQLASMLGGSVKELQGQGPFPYATTQIDVGGVSLDANLLAQRYAFNQLDVANKMTQDELYLLNNPGMYMSPAGPAPLTVITG